MVHRVSLAKKGEQNETAKTAFSEADITVDDPFHGDSHNDTLASGRSRAGTICACRRDVCDSPENRRPGIAIFRGGEGHDRCGRRSG